MADPGTNNALEGNQHQQRRLWGTYGGFMAKDAVVGFAGLFSSSGTPSLYLVVLEVVVRPGRLVLSLSPIRVIGGIGSGLEVWIILLQDTESITWRKRSSQSDDCQSSSTRPPAALPISPLGPT